MAITNKDLLRRMETNIALYWELLEKRGKKDKVLRDEFCKLRLDFFEIEKRFVKLTKK